MLMKEVPFQSLQSRRFEARRGLVEATPPTQNVLAQGQSEAYGDSKRSSWQRCCPARILDHGWRKGTASRQAMRPQGYRKLQQNKKLKDETKLEASLELQCRETRKLEQNTSGQASRQILKQPSRASSLWKLKQNNMTKKGPFFGSQNVRKSRRAKMALPSSSFHSQLLLVKSAST